MYCTVASVRTETPFKDSTLISSAYITQKIGEADGVIDSYIGQVYVLPLTETPEIIEMLSKGIVKYLLFSDQNPNIEIAEGLNLDDYFAALTKKLEEIQKRVIKLYGSDGQELTVKDRTKISFYPTEASSDPDADNTTQPRFSMNQVF